MMEVDKGEDLKIQVTKKNFFYLFLVFIIFGGWRVR